MRQLQEHFGIVIARIAGKSNENLHLFRSILQLRNVRSKINAFICVRIRRHPFAEQFFCIIQKHRNDLLDVARVQVIRGYEPRNEICGLDFGDLEELQLHYFSFRPVYVFTAR